MILRNFRLPTFTISPFEKVTSVKGSEILSPFMDTPPPAMIRLASDFERAMW